MKNPGICRMRRLLKSRAVLMLAMAVLLSLGVCGVAIGSGTTEAGHAAEGGHEAVHGEAGHGEAGTHGEEGGHGGKGWVATDTYRVMNFAVLAIALFFLLRKPVAQALNARIQGIKEQLDDLESKKVKAEKELADYNKKLSLLEQEAEHIVEEYIRQGNEAKARILKEAESAAQKLEVQARRNIDHEFKQAKIKLQEEILDKALAKAEDILTARITEDDQDRLVDEYLEKVVA